MSETTSNSDMSNVEIHSFLIEWEQHGLEREINQNTEWSRHTSGKEGSVTDHNGEELELIALFK